MGTSMESIMDAYKGFSRQNFTMLDNLAEGYAGTKEGMEKLLEDAEKLSGQKYSIDSFTDMVDAIHVVQESMGIAGTSSKEAAGTIQGSAGSAKAAWENLVTALAAKPEDNISIGEYIDNFVNSAITSLEQMIPTIERILVGIGQLIEQGLPVILNLFPKMIIDMLPELIQSGTALITAIAEGVIDNTETLSKSFIDVLKTSKNLILNNLPSLLKLGGQMLLELTYGIIDMLDELTPIAVEVIDFFTDEFLNDENLDKIIDASLELILKLAEGLAKNAPKLIGAVSRVVERIYEYFLAPENAAKIATVAAQICILLAEGIVKGIFTVLAAFGQLVFALSEKIEKVDWKQLGLDIINGVGEGLKSAWKNVENWFKNSWDSLIDKAKSVLGIHSPSKVFSKIGSQTAEGFGIGFENQFDKIKTDVEKGLNFDEVDINTNTNHAGANPLMQPISLSLNIDNFNNYSSEDIETLADQLMTIINQKSYRAGAVYA